jgi:hypothetical protein
LLFSNPIDETIYHGRNRSYDGIGVLMHEQLHRTWSQWRTALTAKIGSVVVIIRPDSKAREYVLSAVGV